MAQGVSDTYGGMMRSVTAMMAMVAAFGLAGAAVARADERMFTYSYEAKTLPQGTWEFE